MKRLRVLGLVGAIMLSAACASTAKTDDVLVEMPAPAAVEASIQPRAYMVVLGTVTDRPAFAAGYAAKLPPLYEKYGGRYLAIGRTGEMLEGEADGTSYVLSEWPSMDAARAFWNSPEYAELKAARIAGGWGTFTVYLFPGIPPTTIAPMAREAAPAPR
jgi:uncharacterized protein (DUF1330 family)